MRKGRKGREVEGTHAILLCCLVFFDDLPPCICVWCVVCCVLCVVRIVCALCVLCVVCSVLTHTHADVRKVSSLPLGVVWSTATVMEVFARVTNKAPLVSRGVLATLGMECTVLPPSPLLSALPCCTIVFGATQVRDAKARTEIGYTNAVSIEEGLQELREMHSPQAAEPQPWGHFASGESGGREAGGRRDRCFFFVVGCFLFRFGLVKNPDSCALTFPFFFFLLLVGHFPVWCV